ncbi:unnamed protein product [Paramecium octaurelia]|uniref:Transmembrane protein n=1 Tax=Paramecium octaurelia TaxID=43137 RepID=A0A8S1SL18_PAROT|nr:unnamed protein product [Paramecium octaurelia]
MEILCVCCECCLGLRSDEGASLGGLSMLCCCYCCLKGYEENISGHKSRVYRYINIVLVFIFVMVAVILTAIIQSKTSLSNQQITKIFDNWQLGALTEIQIFDFCPADYELLTNYSIPGIQEGCICMSDRDVSTFECSDWDKFQNCYNIPEKDPIEFSKWVLSSNNSFYAFQLCGKRSTLPFYELLQNKITTAEDCKANGYKVCETQSTEFVYCVLKEETCPIREIIFSQYQLSEYEIQQNNYSLIYDKGFYTYVSLSKETFPLMNFAIVKGKGVCFDNSIQSLNPKLDEDYILFDPAPEDCTLDDSYYQISTINERQLFNLNNILSLVQAERPLYDISNKVEYQLLAQNQIQFKEDCRSKNFEQLVDLDSRFKSQRTITICQLVFSCVAFVIILLFMLNELHRCCYKDCGKCFGGIQLLIKELIVYLLGVTVIVAYAFMMDLVNTIDDFTSKNCFPQSGQDRMNQVRESLVNTALSLSYCLLINVGLMMVINFFMSTFLCFKNYKLSLKMPNFFTRQKSYRFEAHRYNPDDYKKKEEPIQNQNNYQNPYQAPNQDNNRYPYLAQNLSGDQKPYPIPQLGHNNNPDRYQGYDKHSYPPPPSHYQQNPIQYQQNPTPQYYEQQVIHNKPPQHQYVQNQAVEDEPPIIQEEDPPVIKQENQKYIQ